MSHTLARHLWEFTPEGSDRRLAGFCPVGATVNEARERGNRSPESLDGLRALMREQAATNALASSHDCFSLRTCADCKLGQEMFTESVFRTAGLTLSSDAAHAFFRAYGASGSSRVFPRTCPVGADLASLIQLRDGNPSIASYLQGAIEELDRVNGCSTCASCLGCTRGQEVALEDLSDLAEDGLPTGWLEARVTVPAG